MDKAIDFMHSKWSFDCKDTDFDIGMENFEKIANKVFKNLVLNKKTYNNPFVFRICGQSGSGKTTQLLPAVRSVTDDDFININIRMFSIFHPNYNYLLDEFGEEMIREKTNGFALLMLFRIAEKLIQNKYNIVFEMTLLDDDFEKYLLCLIKEHNYIVHFHILSIPKIISNEWIEKRKNTSKIEKNRVVLKTTSNYFYDILPDTLEKMRIYNIWTDSDKIIIWNGFSFNPVIYGNINDKNIFIIFNKYREQNVFAIQSEEELLKNKILWFKENYKFLINQLNDSINLQENA